jgi:hypothetical protein
MGGANLMAGPPPKPDGQRRRTNAMVAMTQLPNEGYQGPIPEWPLRTCSKAERERWNWIWRTPQAAIWIRAGITDVVARYVRNCLVIEAADAAINVAGAYLVAEVRQQEDRLGRSPMSMLRMRWEAAPDAVDEVRKEDTRRGTRRLRAIDPTAVTAEEI